MCVSEITEKPNGRKRAVIRIRITALLGFLNIFIYIIFYIPDGRPPP